MRYDSVLARWRVQRIGNVTTDAVQTLTNKTLSNPDGTKAAPSYSFASETNTGLYWRTAGLLTASIGGANYFDWYANFGTPQARIGSGGSLVIASG
jgi:hypothetical protein